MAKPFGEERGLFSPSPLVGEGSRVRGAKNPMDDV